MTPFFGLAAITALKEFPLLNASVDGYDILLRDDINLGIAVAIETGLIVPVIKKANNFDLATLAKKLADLASRARSISLNLMKLMAVVSQLPTLGCLVVLSSTPIINQPQVAILSVGAIVRKPVVIEGMKSPLDPCAQ